MPVKNEPQWGGQCRGQPFALPLIFPHLNISPSLALSLLLSFFLPLPYSRCLAWGLRFPPQPQSLPTLPQGPKCSRIRDVEIMWLEYFHPASRKSGSADCLFEGKEASAKHPVLKSLPGFCSAGAAQLPLWRQGERNVEEKPSGLEVMGWDVHLYMCVRHHVSVWHSFDSSYLFIFDGEMHSI